MAHHAASVDRVRSLSTRPEEVAACGAPRERQGGARIDNAGSGHARSMQANAMPTRGPMILAAWRHCVAVPPVAGGGRHFTKPWCNPRMPAAFGPTSVGSLSRRRPRPTRCGARWRRARRMALRRPRCFDAGGGGRGCRRRRARGTHGEPFLGAKRSRDDRTSRFHDERSSRARGSPD
jgi:hypothetical protein